MAAHGGIEFPWQFAQHSYLPFARFVNASHEAHGCCLAAAAGADKPKDRALRHVKCKSIHCRLAAKSLGEVLRVDSRFAGWPPRLSITVGKGCCRQLVYHKLDILSAL